MVRPPSWFDRKFSFASLSPEGYSGLIERLRGHARLADRMRALPHQVLIQREGEGWSIQDHAGHLFDLDALDKARLADCVSGGPRSSPPTCTWLRAVS